MLQWDKRDVGDEVSGASDGVEGDRMNLPTLGPKVKAGRRTDSDERGYIVR